MFSSGIIAASLSDPVIDEFTVTAGEQTQVFNNKDVYRGYRVTGTFTGFGSVSPGSIEIGNGHTADLDTAAGATMSFVVPAFYEDDPASGAANVMNLTLFFPNEAASVPTNNDTNFFKSLKIINNTTGTENTIQRSACGFTSRTATSGNGYSVHFTKTETLNISTNNSVKVQLRSD